MSAKSEESLLQISKDLTDLGIRFHLFFEPDYNRGYTSLTTEPLYSDKQRAYFRKHRMYKFNPKNAFSITAEFAEDSKTFSSIL